MEYTDQLATFACKRYAQLDAAAKNWVNHWDDVAKYIVPRKDNVYGNNVPGDKKHQHLFDSTAINSNDELGAALSYLMSNPSTQWFEFTTGIPRLDKIDSVSRWLHDAAKITQRSLSDTNFYTAIQETYADTPSFGTGVLFQEEDENGDIYFTSFPIYEWRCRVDHKGDIVAAYRKYKLTVEAMADEFGTKNFNDSLKNMLQNTPDREMEIIHMIEPRKSVERIIKGKTRNRLPYTSAHILVDTKTTLRIKGYGEFPASFPRFSRSSGEVYGRGPGMKALPDIKTLNQMEKTQLQSEQFRMAPPLQATENALLRPVNYKPFGVTFRKPGSDKLEPLFSPSAVGAESGIGFIERKERKVERHFFIPQLRTIENDRMTATEIIQRRDEQFRSLGAILIRLSRELLEPQINRHFALLWKKGAFPEAPAELAEIGGAFKIRYTSMIARAQIVGDAENFTRAISIAAPILEAQPETWDNIEGDEVLRGTMQDLGVNPSFIRKPNKRDSIRQARAQAQAEQADMMQAEQASNIMKNTGEAIGEQAI